MRPSVFCFASGASRVIMPERLRHEAFCLLLRERRISRNHARSLPPGMNSERDQPLADAEQPLTSAPPGTRRSAVTDAVGLAPSLLPRPGAVAITVTTTALAGVWCGVGRRVCPGVRVSVVWRVSRWVGLVLRLVCEVLLSVSCVSRLPPVSLNRYA